MEKNIKDAELVKKELIEIIAPVPSDNLWKAFENQLGN